MTQQFSYGSSGSNVLPKPYAKAVVAARSGLVHALREAVESGDAPAAKNFYSAVAGPRAANKLENEDALIKIGRWLEQEP